MHGFYTLRHETNARYESIHFISKIHQVPFIINEASSTGLSLCISQPFVSYTSSHRRKVVAECSSVGCNVETEREVEKKGSKESSRSAMEWLARLTACNGAKRFHEQLGAKNANSPNDICCWRSLVGD
ncbi:hypothetical protein LguiB_012267 [Lonicera macranthoides]